MQQAIEQRNPRPRNTPDCLNVLQDAWYALPSTCFHMYESLESIYHRISAVLRSREREPTKSKTSLLVLLAF